MKMLEHLLGIFYLWFGYKIFKSKTFGSVMHQLRVLIMSSILIASSVLYFYLKKSNYLIVPIIPYAIYFYFDNNIKKRMKTIIYKKISHKEKIDLMAK